MKKMLDVLGIYFVVQAIVKEILLLHTVNEKTTHLHWYVLQALVGLFSLHTFSYKSVGHVVIMLFVDNGIRLIML